MDNSKLNTLKLDTYQKLSKVLAGKIEIAGKISRFGIAIEQLDTNQKKLTDLHSLLSKDMGSIESTKNILRNALTQKTLAVLTILQIFAYDKKKKNLGQRLEGLTSEYIQTCTDIQLINVSKKIWKIANKYGGYSLAYINKIKATLNADKSKALIKLEKEYGLIPDMIKSLEESNIKFIQLLLAYQKEMKEQDKIIKKIKKIYNQTESLLQNKIDRFVLLFENEHPAFYKDYQEARKITMQKEIAPEEKAADNEVSDEVNKQENALENIRPKPETKEKPRPVKKAEV